MFKKEEASKNGLKGGEIRGAQQRIEALERYYKNPIHCMKCNFVIEARELEPISKTRKRLFCNKSCAMSFKRTNGVTTGGAPPEVTSTLTRDSLLERELSKLEDLPRKRDRGLKIAYSKINNDARRRYLRSKKPMCCAVCGYDKHVEIAHRRAVSAFDGITLISEINAISNLGPLCRNHHWEQENELLSPEDLAKFLSH